LRVLNSQPKQSLSHSASIGRDASDARSVASAQVTCRAVELHAPSNRVQHGIPPCTASLRGRSMSVLDKGAAGASTSK